MQSELNRTPNIVRICTPVWLRSCIGTPVLALCLWAACAGVLCGQVTKPKRNATPPLDTTLRGYQDSAVRAAFVAIARDSGDMQSYQVILGACKEHKDYDRMMIVAERMIARNRTSSMAHFLYADAFMELGEPDSAVVWLKRLLQIDPAFIRARAVMAEAYTVMKLYDSALFQLDTALLANPRYTQAYLQRGALLHRMGREEASLADYRSAAELVPGDDVPWIRLARACYVAGHYQDAVDALTYALKVNPENPDALLLLGQAQIGAGNVHQAIQTYTQFMAKFPWHERAPEAEKALKNLRENTVVKENPK